MKSKNFKEELVQRIKEAGQDLIDRADQMVGDNDLITDFSIRVHCQPFDVCPTIEWTTEVFTKSTCERLKKGD